MREIKFRAWDEEAKKIYYFAKAANMSELARSETDPQIRADLEKLVMAYLRLADRADRGMAYRVHPPHPVLQQQQPQKN
jgi:hypothetical protein